VNSDDYPSTDHVYGMEYDVDFASREGGTDKADGAGGTGGKATEYVYYDYDGGEWHEEDFVTPATDPWDKADAKEKEEKNGKEAEKGDTDAVKENNKNLDSPNGFKATVAMKTSMMPPTTTQNVTKAGAAKKEEASATVRQNMLR
jgi:hypothetical protein